MKKGAWREDAIGYLFVQAREHSANIDTYDLASILKVQYTLELACEIARADGHDERIAKIAECIKGVNFDRRPKHITDREREWELVSALAGLGMALQALIEHLSGTRLR